MEPFSVQTEQGRADLTPIRDGWQATTTASDPQDVELLLSVAADALGRDGGGRIEYWVHGGADAETVAPRKAGFGAYRDLWQMRCPLPVGALDFDVRAFTEADLDAFIDVNNRAFDWHPEQGGVTPEAVAKTQSEDWYDPEGFLLHERDGRVVAFCWTKIHHDLKPKMGEIYVIAVDPEFHGLGLGESMTRAGLRWLASQGLRHAMLYVESDNEKAISTYKRIGFSHHHSDIAFERFA